MIKSIFFSIDSSYGSTLHKHRIVFLFVSGVLKSRPGACAETDAPGQQFKESSNIQSRWRSGMMTTRRNPYIRFFPKLGSTGA